MVRRNSFSVSVRFGVLGSLAALLFAQPPAAELENLRRQAEAAANRGEWSDAASLYRSAIALDGGATWGHRGLGDIYRANGVWDKAAEQYDEASNFDPNDGQTKRLASLTHRVAAEEQAGLVSAQTLRALFDYPWAWLPSGGARDVALRSEGEASPVQRIPIRAAFPRDKFALDSLPPAAMIQLEEVVRTIEASPDRILKIDVEGYTCRCGTEAANIELGRKRAEAVRDFLVARGVASASDVTTISFGSSRPVESPGAPSLPAAICERDVIHSQNRRVVIVVHGQTKVVPRLDVSFLSRASEVRPYEVVRDGSRLRTGDEFRIRLRAETTVYAYAFHHGSSGKWEVVFPDEPTRVPQTPNPIQPGREWTRDFIVTGNPGMEETFVYSRSEPDQALEALIKSFREGHEIKALPPDLAVPEAGKQQMQAGQRQSPADTKRSPQGSTSGSSGHVTPPPPTPTPVEGEEPVRMKDLTRREELPRLPPDPAAFVRFSHLK